LQLLIPVAAGVLILALVVWVINRKSMMPSVAWLLVVPTLVLSLLSSLIHNNTLLVWSSLLEATLYFYAAGMIIAYMMQDYRVTIDELFAAGATFTLLAWGFAYVYLACQLLFPGSFIGLNAPGEPRTFVELLSLSFANLSATGLGDILPLTSAARVLVMLEQFAGVAYIAVVVSRLIGMTLVQYQDKQKS
jgi:Ion channel